MEEVTFLGPPWTVLNCSTTQQNFFDLKLEILQEITESMLFTNDDFANDHEHASLTADASKDKCVVE